MEISLKILDQARINWSVPSAQEPLSLTGYRPYSHSEWKNLKAISTKEDGKDGVVWLYIYTVDFSTCFVLK